MLESLEIHGFRGFKDLLVEDLTKINLFVGTNNSGKTSLLEAVEILVSGYSPYSITRSLNRRGEYLPFLPETRRNWEYDITHLFLGHKIKVDDSFSLGGKDNGVTLSYQAGIEKSAQVVEIAANPPRQSDLTIKGSFAIESNSIEWSFLLDQGIIKQNPTFSRQDFEIDGPSLTFVPPGSLNASEMITIWNDVSLNPEQEQVEDTLRIIEPGIQKIDALSRDPQQYVSFNLFQCRHRDFPMRLPLSSMGDGIRRLLALSLAAVKSSGGYLLIDEVDTGLHYTVMGKMWRMLIETARRLDIQIFATTHSLDCIRSLAFLLSEEPGFEEDVRLHRLEPGREKTVVYMPDEIELAMQEHIEVR